MKYNCPVCDKSGLENYIETHVTCPQCNSDLKPYLLINKNVNNNTSKILIYLVFLLGVSSVVLIGLYLNISNDLSDQNESNLAINNQYADTVKTLRLLSKQETSASNINNSHENYNDFIYLVKSGDNLSKIAKIFYGKPELYNKIVSDNNLTFPYSIQIGQKITIKIKGN